MVGPRPSLPLIYSTLVWGTILNQTLFISFHIFIIKLCKPMSYTFCVVIFDFHVSCLNLKLGLLLSWLVMSFENLLLLVIFVLMTCKLKKSNGNVFWLPISLQKANNKCNNIMLTFWHSQMKDCNCKITF